MSHVLKVTFTRLIGFIDILNHMGGKADLAAISSKEQLHLVDILPILETGQMLDFIKVKSGDVSITEKGYSILAASPTQQKIILKQTLMNLKPFQKLVVVMMPTTIITHMTLQITLIILVDGVEWHF